MQYNTPIENQLIIALTGHRGDKLGGWDNNSKLNQLILQRLQRYLEKVASENPSREIVAVSGMALGADTLWALAIINARAKYPNIKLHAAVPFHGQEKRWRPEQQGLYTDILMKSNSVCYVTDRKGSDMEKWEISKAMHLRNEYMCNIAETLIAVYDGVSKSGGTYECLKYAKQGRTVTDKEGNVTEHHYSSSLKNIFYLRYRDEFQQILL